MRDGRRNEETFWQIVSCVLMERDSSKEKDHENENTTVAVLPCTVFLRDHADLGAGRCHCGGTDRRGIDHGPLKLLRFQLPQEENWHHHKINNSTRISC